MDTPTFTDEQIEWLRDNLVLDCALIITPPQDGYTDPLNQMPPTVGMKVSATLMGRPQPIRVWTEETGNVERGTRPDTHIGQWGWVLNTEKADELRHWATYRFEVPKGRINGSLTPLVEGALAPEPS